MSEFPLLFANFLNAHFYTAPPNSPERIGLSWLPDEYHAIRTLMINDTRSSSLSITSDETFPMQVTEQCAHLTHQFSHFLRLERDREVVFLDQFSDLRQEQYALYRYERARFYDWKLRTQKQDFSQIECAEESLAKYALLSNLEKLIQDIEASAKNRVVFINLDDLKSFFSIKDIKQKISRHFSDAFVIILTQQSILAFDDIPHMYYDPLFISFYDLVVQAASMTNTPIYSWYVSEFDNLYLLLVEYEEPPLEDTSDAIAKIEALPISSNPLPITLSNKQYYQERLCYFFFTAKEQPSTMSSFSRFKEVRDASLYLPKKIPDFVTRTFNYLTRWDSVYGASSYTIGDTKESFNTYSLFSQVLRLRDTLVQSCHRESFCPLVVIDFDGTMTNSQTLEINGGLDNWIALINECTSKFNARFIFMTARPQFYGQHDKIKEVKTAILQGNLNMIGTCYLSGLASKAEVIALLSAMINYCLPTLTLSRTLIDDNLLMEIMPAQQIGIDTVQSHNIPGTFKYEEFKCTPFVSNLLSKLARISTRLLTTEAAKNIGCHFTPPPSQLTKATHHETDTPTL